MKKTAILFVVFLNAAVFAQNLPSAAVYVFGSVGFEDAAAVGNFMSASLISSGLYRGIERPADFIAELNGELLKNSGGAGENPVRAVGKRFGAEYVCVVQITPAFDMVSVSAYIMDVETAGIVFTGESLGAVNGVTDLITLSGRTAENMLPKSIVQTERQTQTTREIQAAPQTQNVQEIQAAPQTQNVQEVQAAPQTQNVQEVQAAPQTQNVQEIQAAPQTQVVQEVQAARDPPPQAKPEKTASLLSAGAGGVFLNDFGGGVEWKSGERMAMPYYGRGAYLFFDVTYAEISVSYSGGSGKWASASVSNRDNLPTMYREYVNFGLFGKYPVGWGIVKLFPLLGIDCGLSISGRIKTAGGNDYRFDGKNDDTDWRGEHPEASALSALWFKFGGGADVELGSRLYLRVEALYGRRAANEFESGLIDGSLGYESRGRLESALTGHGIDCKIGLGVKI